MRRKIIVFILIAVCYLLQTTLFSALSLPLSLRSSDHRCLSIWIYEGKEKRAVYRVFLWSAVRYLERRHPWILFPGLYVYWIYQRHVPQAVLSRRYQASDVTHCRKRSKLQPFIYFILFLFRNRYDFSYYFLHIMIPELVYTMVITIFLYFIILKINQRLEVIEKRSASKFV